MALLYTTTLNLLKSTCTFRIITQQKDVTPPPKKKTNMTMENPPFEDVFPIEHVSFQGCQGFLSRLHDHYVKPGYISKKTGSASMTKRDLEVSSGLQIHPRKHSRSKYLDVLELGIASVIFN